MGVITLLVRLIFCFHVVTSESNISCDNDFRNITSGKKFDDLTQICKEKRCISKCCPSGLMYYYTPEGLNCRSLDEIHNLTNRPNITMDYSQIDIYEINTAGLGLREKSNLNLIDHFQFINNKKYNDANCSTLLPVMFRNEYKLGVDSSLSRDQANYYWRWIKWVSEDFCVELMVQHSKKGVIDPFPAYRVINYKNNNKLENNKTFETYSAATMLVSIFFLLLVLFVYGAIRELRNLVGIMLMAYVSTLALSFLLQAINKLLLYKTPGAVCRVYSAINYSLTLSLFFWMNVMSLDIWWTFRGIFKSRPIHRRGELSKFIWYAVYAWGVPLSVSVVVVVIDNVDLSASPDIFKPHFEHCLTIMYGRPEIRYYMYMPCLALIILNWLFFFMTAFNIWRIRKNMSKFSNEAANYKNNQNRFGLYLKLAFVMGITFILEITGYLPRWLEKTATIWNNLLGVAIFFIFVFKRKILLLLCKRFSVKGKLVDNLQRKYSNYSSTTTSKSDRRKNSIVDINSDSTMAKSAF